MARQHKDLAMYRLKAVALLGLGLAFGAAAQTPSPPVPDPSATLTEIGGKHKVMVNEGKEFLPAKEGMRLKAGDRIMIGDDSEATIKFDDECERELDENKIVTVSDRSPCAGAVLVQQELNPGNGAAIGGTSTGSNGALPIAAVLALDAYLFFREDNNDIVSP